MLYPEATVQSQYAASPTIRALVDGLNERIDPRADIKLFYDDIFNLETAQGAGLDIWARIVGVSRNVEVTDFTETFGFFGSELNPWDQGIFYEPDNASVGSYKLSDNAFRQFILWKALANISTCDAYTLNRLFSQLLSQNVIIRETGVMVIRLITTKRLEDWQRVILKQYGLFGKPAGVGFEFATIETPALGFVPDGENLQPFGQAPMYNGTIYVEDLGD